MPLCLIATAKFFFFLVPTFFSHSTAGINSATGPTIRPTFDATIDTTLNDDDLAPPVLPPVLPPVCPIRSAKEALVDLIFSSSGPSFGCTNSYE